MPSIKFPKLSISQIMSQTKLISISILLGVLLVGTAYFMRIYESPEDCYVRKMNEWAKTDEQKVAVEKIVRISNPKLSVSASKAFLSETSKSELTAIRFRMKTYMDYCKVE